MKLCKLQIKKNRWKTLLSLTIFKMEVSNAKSYCF
jgi:hypothetical protein